MADGLSFRSFLAPREPVVLPYFGGTRVDAADRRYRVEVAADPGAGGEFPRLDLRPGWWRFAIDGRRASPIEKAEPVDLGSLPAIRGHWVDGHIAGAGQVLARVALPPSEEPAPLARVVGRRWYSGEVLLDSIEFEDDAELAVRAALEGERGIAGVRGVVPSLRSAFAYALGLAVARAGRVPVTPRELTPAVVAIADGGRDAVLARLAELVRDREQAERERAARRQVAAVMQQQRQLRTVAARAQQRVHHGSPAERADAALEAAGARMLSARRTGDALEVTFTFMDVRIIATVAPDTLHVYDAGICLDGADEELTLDSLPSVIKEAIEDGRLNITRH